ncbi:MAG: hypothetical protein Q8M24_12240, partial [Pseudolabrys sp.]|nr:hypothetical protein [Pseudolabrys sp.]
MRGRTVRISLPRRMVIDFLHFAAAVPTIPVQRRMALRELAGARAACRDRVRWTVLFTKAYALVAREFPELRRAYVTIPWPMFYEYPVSYANVVVERTYEGERALFSIIIKDPAERPLQELGVFLQDASAANIDDVKEFRRSLRIARLPLPLRRLIWWVGLNVGRQRARHFGTFTLSVYSALDAESLHPLTPLTTLLTYGVIDRDGNVNVRIIYDHRVLDGATVARALARLEEILNTEIVSELRSLS